MVWLAIALAVVAVAAIVAWFVIRRQLDRQRSLTAEAERQAAEHSTEIAALTTQLDDERTARASADVLVISIQAEAATVAEERDRARSEAESSAAEHNSAEERAKSAQAFAAEERRRAGEAERRAEEAERRASAAQEQVMSSAERATLAERRLASIADTPVDPSDTGESASAPSAAGSGSRDETGEILWALELSRSERTWRNSVAVSTEGPSVFEGASDILLEALHVEVEAAREDVGAVVELDADIPATVNPQGSLVALRATQELLDATMRRSDVTTVHVHGDGTDLIVTVAGVDENDQQVAPPVLTLPPSARVEAIEGGIRIRGAIG